MKWVSLTLCFFFLYLSILLSLFFPGQSLICVHFFQAHDMKFQEGRFHLDLKGTFLNLKTWCEKTVVYLQTHSHWTSPRRDERHPSLHKGTTDTAIPPTGTRTYVTILQGCPIPTTLPRSVETRHNHQAHTCQLWQETEGFLGITWDLPIFATISPRWLLSLTQDHHTILLLSSLQPLSSCTQISHFSMPQLALLNIPICTKNAITLASDTGTEDAFGFWSKSVIYIFTLYFVIHVIITVTTRPSAGLYSRCPFSITRNHSGRTLFWVIRCLLYEESYNILMKNPHFLLITLTARDTEQWNANTCREVAPHASICTQKLSQKPSGESPDRILCILRSDPRMKLRLPTCLACGTAHKKEHSK